MDQVQEIKRLIVAQGDAWEEFKASYDQRMDKLEESKGMIEAFMAKSSGPFAKPGGNTPPGERPAFHVKQSDGTLLPVLSKSATLAGHFSGSSGSDDFVIAEWCRDVMTGRKAASSSALVPVGISANVIDNVRAQTTVIQAGAGTIVVDGPTNAARLTGDPTVHEHAEAASDISESDITVVPVSLNPKSLVAMIPLSMEVVADSPNLDAVLNMSLAAAFGAKLDALALATILADANIPTSATGQDPAAWLACLAAISAAMTANQPIPTAMITAAADFIARASQLASTGGQWLGKPPALASMSEYPTTGIAAGTAIYGGFDRAFAIAMRQELRLEVVRFGKPTSASHVLVAHMRAAGVVLQPKRLFIQKKTVS